MGAKLASTGTVHLLSEKLHYTSPMGWGGGHTLAEFDSTNAVAQLTSRGQSLHLSLTSAAGYNISQLAVVLTLICLLIFINLLHCLTHSQRDAAARKSKAFLFMRAVDASKSILAGSHTLY
jgi:hypothetical protein